jgi:hypothetical protein
MNDIDRLRELVNQRFPGGSQNLVKPRTESGSWWLDISLNGYALIVEWRKDAGFGLSTPTDDDFGLGPDEIYPDIETAFERIKELLLSQTATKAPARATLSKIRESRRLSQVELASRLSINQGAFSRMERRSDMLIGTLRNVIAALGGELHLIAHFPDETVYISLDSEEARQSLPDTTGVSKTTAA